MGGDARSHKPRRRPKTFFYLLSRGTKAIVYTIRYLHKTVFGGVAPYVTEPHPTLQLLPNLTTGGRPPHPPIQRFILGYVNLAASHKTP